ncbi:septum formation family protein [Actinoplanes sp. NPDC004185]
MDHQPPLTPGPQYPAYTPPPPPRPAWNGKTNGFSIASLALALMGCAGLPSIIFGVIGLRQSKRNGDRRGRFYAIAGLVVCGLWALAIAVAVGVAVVRDAADGPDRDATGAINGARELKVTELRVGDCLKDISSQTGSYVDVVPCSTTHYSEVFALFPLREGDWPGDAQVKETARTGCDDRYAAYAGVKLDEDSWTVLAVPPEELHFSSDRDVLCLAHHLRVPTTGSLRR